MKVVNVKGMKANDPAVTYCGRSFGGWVESPLHNPFRKGQKCQRCGKLHGNPQDTIPCYRAYLQEQVLLNNQVILAALNSLTEDSVLGCWCKPNPCHCDVVIEEWRKLQELKNYLVIGVTGHRPDKLGGYDDQTYNRLVDLAVAVFKLKKPQKVITGMALGWDQACCEGALRLKIPVCAALPFPGFDSKWPDAAVSKFGSLLRQCSERVWVSEDKTYSAKKLFDRNKWVVDRCSLLVALYDGSMGGTHNTVEYAKSVDREMLNVWKSWEKFK